MWQLLANPAAQSLSMALIHFVWQGALLAAGANLLLRRLTGASPAHRYAVCLTTLALMGACPLATFALFQSRTVSSAQAPVVIDAGAKAAMFSAPTVTPGGEAQDFAGNESDTFALLFVQQWMLAAWLTGVLILSARVVGGYVGTLWLRGGTEQLSDELAARVARVASRLGVVATGRVFVSLRASEAMAVGWLRPVVLVPLGWLTLLPPDALEAVIAHELAHLRRHDLWANLLQRSIETLLFYHPAVWWLSRRTTLEREFCCDELAVGATGQRLSYAQTLELLGTRASGGAPRLLATTFLGGTKMNLLARVRHVLGMRPDRERGRAWPAGAAAIGLAVAVGSISMLPARQSALADDEREAKAERQEGDRSPEARDKDRRSPEGEARRRDDDGRDRPRGDVPPPRREEDRDRPDFKDRPRGDNPLPPRRGDAPPPRREGDNPPPRRDGGRFEAGPGMPPPSPRDRELIELIRQLRHEVAELRREVSQLRGDRGGPRPGPRDGEFIDRPRDGERGVRGEGQRFRPRDGEEGKAAPRDERAGDARSGDEGPRKEDPRDAKPGPEKQEKDR